MHSAGNFNPEWGYLAPAPSFMRTARAVLVATAIGATAGAAVVISLIDRPADDAGKARSITAHAIVTGVQAATAPTTPPAAAAAASVAAPISLTATAAPAAAVPAAAVGAPIAVTATAAPAVAAAPAASVAAPIASAATSTALPAVQPQSPAVRVMLPSSTASRDAPGSRHGDAVGCNCACGGRWTRERRGRGSVAKAGAGDCGIVGGRTDGRAGSVVDSSADGAAR